MRLSFLTFLFALVLIVSNISQAIAEDSISEELKRQLEQEKVVGAKGEASFGEVTNDVRKCQALALERAKRNAAEQGSAVLINSLTEVENFQLTRDEIRSRVQAIVIGYEVLDQGFVGESGYFYKIRAKVKGQVPDKWPGIGNEKFIPPTPEASIDLPEPINVE